MLDFSTAMVEDKRLELTLSKWLRKMISHVKFYPLSTLLEKNDIVHFQYLKSKKVYLLGIIFRKLFKNVLHHNKRYTKNEGEMRSKTVNSH